MIIGYEICGYDNDSHMTGNWNKFLPEIKSIIPKCDSCGYRLDYKFINPHFKLNRKTLDFSSTYDGVTIVSLKFKEFCNRYGYDNLEFTILPSTPNFYGFAVIENTLPYNFITKEKLCKKCGQYESVVGPTLNLDNINEPLTDGFYQSDLWFASGNEKSPVLIIAPSTKANFDKEKFKNICFTKIEKNNIN
jgi:hypothetical protein